MFVMDAYAVLCEVEIKFCIALFVNTPISDLSGK